MPSMQNPTPAMARLQIKSSAKKIQGPFFANDQNYTIKSLRLISEAFGNIVKIASILSSISGSILMFVYMSRTSAPFPTNTSALIPILLIFGSIFAIVATNIVIIAILPALVKMCFPIRSKEILPIFFGDDTEKRENIMRNFCEHALIYMPFLGFMISSLCIILMKSDSSWPIYITVFVAYVISITIVSNLSSQRKMKNKAGFIFKFSYVLAAANFVSMIWFLPLVIFFISQIPKEWQELDGLRAYAIVSVIWIFLAFSHGALSFRKSSGVAVFGFGLLALFMVMVAYPGASSLSALSLRILGIGGGLPVDILVKEPDLISNQTKITEKSGCILLNFGSDLVFHEVHGALEADEICNVRPKVFDPLKPIEKFSASVVYQRADVLKISAYKAPSVPPRPVEPNK